MRYLLALAFLFPAPVFAAGVCPDSFGTIVLHAAWPTPKYVTCSFDKVSPKSDGTKEISLKVVGESRLSKLPDKEVWIQAVVVVGRDWKPITFKWGDYKGFVKPGMTNKFVMEQIRSHSLSGS